MGAQRALSRSSSPGVDEVEAIVIELIDGVAGRLRASEKLGRTVTLRLRFDDFSRATRSHTLPRPTAHTATLLAAARGLLASTMSMIEHRGLTLVGVAVANLDDDRSAQLALPLDRHGSGALDAAVDETRQRFGSAAVTRAVLLGRDRGPSVPMLPD
jgi:DNA polymerase-4